MIVVTAELSQEGTRALRRAVEIVADNAARRFSAGGRTKRQATLEAIAELAERYPAVAAAAADALGLVDRCADGTPVTEVAGYRAHTRARSTGTLVILAAATVPSDGGRWMLLCDPHGGVLQDDSQAVLRSHMAHPDGWCPGCQDAAESASDRCHLCGSEDLFSGYFHDGLAVDQSIEPRATWLTFCNQCGTQQP